MTDRQNAYFWDRPWESEIYVNREIDVPWERRPWCFNTDKGRPEQIDAKWVISRNEKNEITASSMVEGSDDNRHRYPRLSWAQVVLIFDKAEADGISLKEAARGQVDQNKMTPDQKRAMANARPFYVHTKSELVAIHTERQDAVADAFWNDGVAETPPPNESTLLLPSDESAVQTSQPKRKTTFQPSPEHIAKMLAGKAAKKAEKLANHAAPLPVG